jgi:putative serine protease PepD
MSAFPAPASPAGRSAPATKDNGDLGRRAGPEFTAPVRPLAPHGAPPPAPGPPVPPVPVGPPRRPTPRHTDAPPPVQGRRRTRIPSLLLAATLTGGLAGAGAALWSQPDPGAAASGGPAGGATARSGGGDAAAAAAAVIPSVVQVRAGSSSGSGFVLDAGGHVVTNHHVVEGSSRVRLELSTGRSLSATVVGSNRANDIAVLRAADPSALRPAALGSSAALRIGESVIAVGSPLGLTGTVTGGLVSAVDREARLGDGNAQRVIQTDAPINPGNSGGPLVNLAGEVVGVNTAIATLGVRGSGSIGIGFAVPVDRARDVAERIISGS